MFIARKCFVIQLSLRELTKRLPVDMACHYYPFNAKRHIKASRSEPLNIKIPSKNMREKPTNTPIIHSVY
jgi:hypothetical protein